MKQITLLCRLTDMRRRAGAGTVESVTWAAGLLWRTRSTRT